MVPVAEHHDGFAMYDSGLSDWTGCEDGAASRCDRRIREGGASGGSTSVRRRIAWSTTFSSRPDFSFDVNDPQYAALYGPAHNWLEAGTGRPNDFTFVSQAWTDDWLARSWRRSWRNIILTSH